MTKDDLKTGMVVRTRNFGYYVVMLDLDHPYNDETSLLVNIERGGYMVLREYSNDLLFNISSHEDYDEDDYNWSIDEIYTIHNLLFIFHKGFNIMDNLHSIWKRQE